MPIMGGGGGGAAFNGGTITAPLEIDSNSNPQLKFKDSTGTTLFGEIDAGTTRLDFYRDPNGTGAPSLSMDNTGLFLTDEAGATLVTLQTGDLFIGVNNQMLLRGSLVMFRPPSVPAASALSSGQGAVWLDETPGAAKFRIKAKDANGTVVAAAIALT